MLNTIFAVVLSTSIPSESDISRLVTNAQMEAELMKYQFSFQVESIPALESPILTVKDHESCAVVYNQASKQHWREFTELTETPKQALNVVSLIVLHEIAHCAFGNLEVATVQEDNIRFAWSQNEEVLADAFALSFAKNKLPADEYRVLYYQWMNYRLNNRHSISHDTFGQLKERSHLKPSF